ncbi:MAG: MFS transporter [Treponema sp.]|nr:MFS transporter [Treponema sp.]
MKRHALVQTLVDLRGNPRGCVYTEPLWGIPYNLFAPYASVFMIALGLGDRQIGLIVSLSWACQVVFALLSGAITDKLGRRLTTFLFDILSWGLFALISALARDFWWFLAAGLVNSAWRVTQNSWSCLLVEDANPAELVGIYTWIYIANILVGFAAPLAGALIGRYQLVPTVRGLYLFAAAMFSVKAAVTFLATRETGRGRVRRAETRGSSLLAILGGYGSLLREMTRNPDTLKAAAILIVISVTSMISGNFWGILAVEKLGLPAADVAIFPFIKSAVTILLFFTLTQRLGRRPFRLPLAFGFVLFAASQLLYALAPARGYALLAAGAALEAAGLAVANPLVDRLVALSVNPAERARIQSLLYVGVILVSSPFGWIAGELSHLDRSLPFALNLGLYALGAVLALAAGRERPAALPGPRRAS